MNKQSNAGPVGFFLIAAGAGLAAIGVALVVPVCASWSRSRLEKAYRHGRKSLISGFDAAAGKLGDVASKAQSPLSEAARVARETTAIAAGAVETAAHYVRERVS